MRDKGFFVLKQFQHFLQTKEHEFYKEVQRSKRISKIRVWHNPDVTIK